MSVYTSELPNRKVRNYVRQDIKAFESQRSQTLERRRVQFSVSKYFEEYLDPSLQEDNKITLYNLREALQTNSGMYITEFKFNTKK